MKSSAQRPILAASAAIFRGPFVLLVQRGHKFGEGLWSLPGGKVEFGEQTKEAAAREVLEETGVMAELQEMVGLYEIITKDMHYAIACYAGLHIAGEPKAASDAAQARFVAPYELAGFALAPNTIEAINAARQALDL